MKTKEILLYLQDEDKIDTTVSSSIFKMKTKEILLHLEDKFYVVLRAQFTRLKEIIATETYTDSESWGRQPRHSSARL
jgi:hypothetical protein